MKMIIFVVVFIALVGCQEEKYQKIKTLENPSTKEIIQKMGCENCGMNIRRFIATAHAIHTAEGTNYYYCSINCSTTQLMKNNYSNASIFAIDKITGEFTNVENLYYVVGSKLPAIMTSVSKYAFGDFTIAEQFMMKQEGDSILGYKETFRMCEEELSKM